MESVNRAIKEESNLLVQAPTGLGKTMAISFPALKNSLERGQKLVYLTPKNSQHSVAEDAIEQINQESLKSLTITAKSKICFMPEPVCTPEYCEYARDYYQKVHENKLIDLMAEKVGMDPLEFRLHNSLKPGEARSTGAQAVVSCCPFCESSFRKALEAAKNGMQYYDLTLLVSMALEPTEGDLR